MEIDTHIARITLDRPHRHNALEAVDVRALRDAIARVEDTADVRVMVLTGSGDRTFCSGASLAQMQTGEMSGALFDSVTDRLATCRVPTICRMNGSAYGGGAELALCCDFRIGVRGMRLAVPAARLGVCYPVGGLTRYVHRLGLSTASRLLLAAEDMEDDELLRVGYLTALVDRAELDVTTEAIVDRLRALAPMAVQGMKRILLDISSGGLDREAAQRIIAECTSSADLREGLAAWREGREPRFDGS